MFLVKMIMDINDVTCDAIFSEVIFKDANNNNV